MQATKGISFEEFAQNLERIFASLEEGGEPVIVDWQGHRFRIIQEEGADIWAGYDPELARAAIREAAGALRGVDLEALKAERGLKEMLVTRRGTRLSVQPVEKRHFETVRRMGTE